MLVPQDSSHERWNLQEVDLNLVKLALCLVLFSGAMRTGFSRGTKIIPQIVAGPGWTTNFDLINVSSAQAITEMWLSFYHDNGTKWHLQTSLGTGTEFQLSLQPRQTLRVQAIGGAQLETGYAAIYDHQPGNSEFSEDYVLGISVFYQVLAGTGITETVSVPVREPTAAATAPVQIVAPDIYSAVTIVNLANIANAVQVKLYSEDGGLYGARNIDLAAGEQRTQFLDQAGYFPELTSFKGTVEFTAIDGPIVLLTLLQTRAADGNPQYTLLTPVDKEALRRNTHMALLQANDDAKPFMPLDIDGFISDYYGTTGDPDRLTESHSWDLEYCYGAPNTDNRFLRPTNSAEIVSLGIKNDTQFGALSLPQLEAISTYSTGDLDLSGASLFLNLTFAIYTDLGNYAKARIIRITDTTDGLRNYKDLVLQVVVYR
jgi:hypothetical protein